MVNSMVKTIFVASMCDYFEIEKDLQNEGKEVELTSVQETEVGYVVKYIVW